MRWLPFLLLLLLITPVFAASMTWKVEEDKGLAVAHYDHNGAKKILYVPLLLFEKLKINNYQGAATVTSNGNLKIGDHFFIRGTYNTVSKVHKNNDDLFAVTIAADPAANSFLLKDIKKDTIDWINGPTTVQLQPAEKQAFETLAGENWYKQGTVEKNNGKVILTLVGDDDKSRKFTLTNEGATATYAETIDGQAVTAEAQLVDGEITSIVATGQDNDHNDVIYIYEAEPNLVTVRQGDSRTYYPGNRNDPLNIGSRNSLTAKQANKQRNPLEVQHTLFGTIAEYEGGIKAPVNANVYAEIGEDGKKTHYVILKDGTRLEKVSFTEGTRFFAETEQGKAGITVYNDNTILYQEPTDDGEIILEQKPFSKHSSVFRQYSSLNDYDKGSEPLKTTVIFANNVKLTIENIQGIKTVRIDGRPTDLLSNEEADILLDQMKDWESPPIIGATDDYVRVQSETNYLEVVRDETGTLTITGEREDSVDQQASITYTSAKGKATNYDLPKTIADHLNPRDFVDVTGIEKKKGDVYLLKGAAKAVGIDEQTGTAVTYEGFQEGDISNTWKTATSTILNENNQIVGTKIQQRNDENINTEIHFTSDGNIDGIPHFAGDIGKTDADGNLIITSPNGWTSGIRSSDKEFAAVPDLVSGRITIYYNGQPVPPERLQDFLDKNTKAKDLYDQAIQKWQYESTGLRWDAAYQAALAGAQLGNMLFCPGQQECFTEWGRAVDELFKGAFGFIAYPEETLCRAHIDKAQSDGAAFHITPDGLTQLMAHVEGEKSPLLSYLNDSSANDNIETQTFINERLYKFTFYVKAPESSTLLFNVELHGSHSASLFDGMKRLQPGEEYAERGRNARVKYSPADYDEICLVFQGNNIDWPNPLCNDIVEYAGGPTEVEENTREGFYNQQYSNSYSSYSGYQNYDRTGSINDNW